MFSHLRAHAFARSVTVARSSAVQPSYVAPRTRSPPTGRRRDSQALFKYD